MDEPLLKVEGLCQYFGKHKALDQVSFTVRKGEIFGLVGESGSGKTTTGRAIIGLHPITAGKISFKGQRIRTGYGRRNIALRRAGAPKNATVRQIQMIFQDPVASLDPRMTVGESIAEGLVIHGVRDEALIRQKVRQILEMVGLRPEYAGRYPHEFSGGQRQRIGIARAVIMEPELLIADEPISALDVSVQAQVINLLSDLREKMGLTILFIAHDLSVVKYFCDRIAVLHLGKLVELAPSEELFAHPLHPYTKSLLSAIPLPDPRLEKDRRRMVYAEPPLAERSLRKITAEHLVYCSEEEENAYKKERSL